MPAAPSVHSRFHSKTFAYFAYPPQHWLKIRTNNPMERLLKEARRRTKVVGAFPDGKSALMLVAAILDVNYLGRSTSISLAG